MDDYFPVIDENIDPCKGCPDHTGPNECASNGGCAKRTNADRIRAMTDEELAEFIGGDPMYDICPNNCQNDLDRPCRVCALDWLKQEAEE